MAPCLRTDAVCINEYKENAGISVWYLVGGCVFMACIAYTIVECGKKRKANGDTASDSDYYSDEEEKKRKKKA
jgi:hypothetical protein